MRFEPNLNCRRKAEEFKSASLESAQMTLTGNSYICILYVCIAKSESNQMCKKEPRLLLLSQINAAIQLYLLKNAAQNNTSLMTLLGNIWLL